MARPGLILAVALTLSLTGVPVLVADITPVNYPASLSTIGAVSGDIMNIDPVNHMIQVRDSSGIVQTIHVNDQVQILRRGEVVRLMNLNLGDFVTVSEK